MGKRSGILPYLLLFVLVALLSAGAYLLVRGGRLDRRGVGPAPAATPYVVRIPEGTSPGSPVVKRVFDGGTTAQYLINGSFTPPIERQPRTLAGRFALRGDTSGRSFPVQLGSTIQQLLVGSFEGSFSGTNSWQWVQYEEALPLISDGREVQLQLNLRLDPRDESFALNVELEQQLDKIIAELAGGVPLNSVPDLGRVAVHAVGVVR